MFEHRGVQLCSAMRATGAKLEKALNLEYGRFMSMPDVQWNGFLGLTWAGRVVYIAVALAWVVVAALGVGVA